MKRIGIAFLLFTSLGYCGVARAQTCYGVTSSGTLFRFDLATPTNVVTVGSMGIVPEAIDFRPQTVAQQGTKPLLYALDVGPTTTQLYMVSTLSAAITPVGSGIPSQVSSGGAGDYSLLGSTIGFDFNPRTVAPDNSIRIRVVASNGTSLRLNSDTGAVAAVDTDLNFAAGDVNTGTPSVDGLAYINNNVATDPAGGATTLYDMDFGKDDLLIQNPPNSGTLNTVGSFGIGIDALAGIGFDIFTDPASTDDSIAGHRGYAVMRRTEPNKYLLYDVNLGNGQITNGRLIGGGIDFEGGFAIDPVLAATFRFSASSYTVNENGGSATITVQRVGGSSTASVNYAATNGTAVQPGDYGASFGTLQFTPAQTSRTFTVPIVNDSGDEPNETINLVLTGPINGVIDSPSTAVLTIADNDPTPTFSISGHIANHSGTAMPGTSVSRTGGSNVTTDASGNYSFTGVVAGSYTIAPVTTPALTGVTFTPASTSVTVSSSNLTNINFLATFTISGRVANHSGAGIPNVQVRRVQGSSSVTVVTNASGNFSFVNVRSGSYTLEPVLTPALSGMSFTPVSRSVTVGTTNVTNQNFIGMFSASGRISNSAGVAMPNVLVRLNTSTTSTSTLTDASGNYRFSNVRSGGYTLVPSQSGKTFSPASRSISVTTLSLTNQNFIGSP